MKKYLEVIELEQLRKNHGLVEEEVAFVVGDLIVAENVITHTTRVLGKSTLLTEGARLLKG